MPTVAEKLNEAAALLRESGIVDSRREAASIVGAALGRDRTFLIAHPEYSLTASEIQKAEEFVMRRASREPLQYISGVQEFYGLEFEVTPDVLIPRPETEMVVERAIGILQTSRGGDSVCDVGTGSGCIVISILHHLRDVRGVGLDISPDALSIARRNAAKHGVNDRLELRESDLLSGAAGERFSVIVSNPPYVPADHIAGLQAEVRDFEPRTALTDGHNGLSIISRLIEEAPRFLNSRGHLLLEIGFDQSEKVVEMFDPARWGPAEVFEDLQSIPRLVSARLN